MSSDSAQCKRFWKLRWALSMYFSRARCLIQDVEAVEAEQEAVSKGRPSAHAEARGSFVLQSVVHCIQLRLRLSPAVRRALAAHEQVLDRIHLEGVRIFNKFKPGAPLAISWPPDCLKTTEAAVTNGRIDSPFFFNEAQQEASLRDARP